MELSVAQNSGAHGAERRQAHVLLVDDEEHIREAVKAVLEGRGYIVSACEDALAALQLLEQGQQVDIILLDLMMPRMDGWEFRVQQMRSEKWADIPVIAMSADQSAKARAINADCFLPKPLDLTRLLEMLERLVDTARERNGERARERLHLMGKLADEIVRKLDKPIGFTLGNLQLAQDKASELEKRLSGADSFSLVGIRQLLARAQRGAERIEGLVQGTAAFAHIAQARLKRDKPRVLLLERNGAERTAAELSSEYEVHTAASVQHALEALVDDGPFDVILCPLAGRECMGVDLYTQLKEDGSGLTERIVFTTEGPFDEPLRQFLASARRPQVRRPLQLGELRTIIEAQLQPFQ